MDKEKTFDEYCEENNIQGQINMDDYLRWIESYTGQTLYKKEENKDE